MSRYISNSHVCEIHGITKIDTLSSCFSVQALCFCIVFLNHVKHLHIHATRATASISQLPPQKIHACFDRYSLQLQFEYQ